MNKDNLVLTPIEMAEKCHLDIDKFIDDYFVEHDITDYAQQAVLRGAIVPFGFSFFKYELLDFYRVQNHTFKIIDNKHVELLNNEN